MKFAEGAEHVSAELSVAALESGTALCYKQQYGSHVTRNGTHGGVVPRTFARFSGRLGSLQLPMSASGCSCSPAACSLEQTACRSLLMPRRRQVLTHQACTQRPGSESAYGHLEPH